MAIKPTTVADAELAGLLATSDTSNSSNVAYGDNYLATFGQPTVSEADLVRGTTSTSAGLVNIKTGETVAPVVDTPTTPQNGTTGSDGFPVQNGTTQPGFVNNIPNIDNGGLGALVGVAGSGGTNSAFERSSTDGDGALTKKLNPDDVMSNSDKRLNTIRSRAAAALYKNKGKDTYTSDRGPITTLKLLPGPSYDPKDSVKGAETKVEGDVDAMLAGSFANFFLTDVQVSYNEKTNIVTTFGDGEVVYYFGRQPIVMNISGLLFDSIENDWFANFLTLYAGVLRGTQLAKSFSLVKITLPNMYVTGSISNLSVQQNSQRDTDIPFSFQFIAKEVIPKPAIMNVSGTPSNLSASIVDFKANRAGVQGYTLGMGSLGGGFMDSVNKTVGNIMSSGNGINQAIGGVSSALSGASSLLGGASSLVGGVSSTLNSFRTNIFTPVYGVISSITKIIKGVSGSIAKIVSSFTNPVNAILRDVTNIATQASGLALLVENSVNDILKIPARTITNFNNTVRSLKGAAGTITRVPENISETFRRLYGSGRVKRGAAILSSGKKRNKSKSAILSSGVPYTPQKSNKL